MTYPKVATQSEKLCFSKGLVTKAAFTSSTDLEGWSLSVLEKGLLDGREAPRGCLPDCLPGRTGPAVLLSVDFKGLSLQSLNR